MPVNTYLSNPIYQDKYTRASGWKKLLFTPGGTLQAGELIELQSMLADQNSQLMEAMYANGAILNGVVGTVSGNTLKFSAGQVYFSGYVLDIPSQSITLPDTLSHNVYLLVTETITEQVSNNTLNTSGSADILVWKPSIQLGSGDALLGTINNGIYVAASPRGLIDDRIGSFLHDLYGNYQVSGLDTTVVQSSTPTSTSVTSSDIAPLQSELAALNTYITQLQNLAGTNLNSTTLVSSLSTEITQRQADANALRIRIGALQSGGTTQQIIRNSANFDINPGTAYIGGKLITTTGTSLVVPMDNIGSAAVTGAQYSGVSAASQIINFTQTTAPKPAINFTITSSNGVLTSAASLYAGDVVYAVSPAISPLTVGVPYTISYLSSGTLSLAQSGLPALKLPSGVYSLNRPAQNYLQLSFAGLPSDPIISAITIATTVQGIPDALQDIVNLLNGQTSSATVTSSATDGRSTAGIIALLNEHMTLSLNGNALEITAKPVPNLQNITLNITTAGGTTSDWTSGNLFRTVQASYTLGFQPVIEVTQVLGVVQVTGQAMTRGALSGGRDSIGSTSLVELLRVWQGTTVYVLGVDYTLYNTTDIDWTRSLTSGNQPALGSTYYISYTQNIPITDYTLSNGAIKFNRQVPISFTVNYSYSLNVAGLITLDASGNFNYLLSAPSAQPTAPATPDNVLAVARFNMNSSSVTVTAATESKALSYVQLNQLADTVQATASQLASLQLQISSGNSNGLLPIVADLFHDLSQLDFSSDSFTASLSPITQTITQGIQHATIPLRASGSSANLSNTAVTNSQNTRSISQPLSASYASQVRIYSTDANQFICSTDGFYPCDQISPQTSDISSQVLSAVTNLWGGAALSIADGITQGIPYRNFSASRGYITSLSQATAPRTVVNIRLEELHNQPYSFTWRGNPVSLGSALYGSFDIITNPTLDVVTGFFKSNGLLPSSSSGWSISDGVIAGKFYIPAGTPPGNYALQVSGPDGHSGTLGISVYNNTLQQTALTAAQRWLGYPPVYSVVSDYLYHTVDPYMSGLNQAISITDTIQLLGIYIYIRTIGTGNMRLILRSGDVVVSIGDPVNMTTGLPTLFKFPEVVTLPPGNYSIGLEGTGYEVWTGDFTVDPSIIYQPGMLSTSLTGLDQTVLPSQRLAYFFIEPSYSATTINLGTYTTSDLPNSIQAFALNIRATIPSGSSVTYQYSVNNTLWTSFDPFTTVCLSSPTTTLYLQALLNGNLTPLLRTSGATVSLYSFINNSNAVSKAISTSGYSQVTMNIVASGQPQVYVQNETDIQNGIYTSLALVPSKTTTVDSSLGVSSYTYTGNYSSDSTQTTHSLTYSLALSGNMYIYSATVSTS